VNWITAWSIINKGQRSGCIAERATANAGTFGSENVEFNPKERALTDAYQLAKSIFFHLQFSIEKKI